MLFRKAAVSALLSTIGATMCVMTGTASGFSEATFSAPPAPPLSDSVPIPQPGAGKDNAANDKFYRMITRPFIDFFTLSRYYRAVSGDKVEAKNVDAFGETHTSSWFTNRIGAANAPLDELLRCPAAGDGPDTSGEWTVTMAQSFDASHGLSIRDGRGRDYLIRFDPPGYPELSTGAEMVSANIFHAAGYNVPENYLVAFDPEKFLVGGNVRIKPPRGKPRNMTDDDLVSILRPLDRLPNGTVRVLACKSIEGIPLGGWNYYGTRPDDPNDLIPHEHRRELRGLRVIAGWVNHFDNNIDNTLDVYDPGRRFVKHYYRNFNSTLGSYTTGPMPPARGHQPLFKMSSFIVSFLTSGFYIRPWENYDTVPYRSVGAWESKTYKPQAFQFTLQTPAFDNMTREDAFWAAKIVMSFTDSIIAAIVRTGRYSNPDAGRCIARVLAERRDITGRYYYSKVNPLDGFRLLRVRDSAYELRFTDRAVADGLEWKNTTVYRYRFSCGRRARTGSTDSSAIVFSVSDLSFSDSIAAVRIRTVRKRSPSVESNELRVFLRQRPGGYLALIGLHRD